MLEECSPKGGPEPATGSAGARAAGRLLGRPTVPAPAARCLVGPFFKGPTMPREPSPAARACPGKFLKTLSQKGGAPGARRDGPRPRLAGLIGSRPGESVRRAGFDGANGYRYAIFLP